VTVPGLSKDSKTGGPPARAGARSKDSKLAGPPARPPARGRVRAGAANGSTPNAGGRAAILTFTRLKWVSYTHSCIYAALLLCAFALRKPEPLTFVLGMAHGLLWIAMSLICIVCARLRVVPLRVAVSVAVLGGIGPFFGSYEFVRAERQDLPAVAS
jgi:hypothetical protein